MILIRQIQDAVADHHGIPPETMRAPDGFGSRDHYISRPRQQAMAICSVLTKHTSVTIGRFFGGRDHSTVIHAVKVTRQRSSDPEVSSAMRHVARRLLLEEAGIA